MERESDGCPLRQLPSLPSLNFLYWQEKNLFWMYSLHIKETIVTLIIVKLHWWIALECTWLLEGNTLDRTHFRMIRLNRFKLHLLKHSRPDMSFKTVYVDQAEMWIQQFVFPHDFPFSYSRSIHACFTHAIFFTVALKIVILKMTRLIDIKLCVNNANIDRIWHRAWKFRATVGIFSWIQTTLLFIFHRNIFSSFKYGFLVVIIAVI